MARPVRAAAVRARELIAQGLGRTTVEDDNDIGMSSGEEDELDEALSPENSDIFGGMEAEQAGADASVTRASTARSGYSTYGDVDEEPNIPDFHPERPPGPYVSDTSTRCELRKCTKALDFFSLFFTTELLELICYNTNLYAWCNILEKPTYSSADGSWDELTLQELRSYLGLVIMMGFINLPDVTRYWSQSTLYSGGWASRFMSRTRYKAISGMLHVSNHADEDVTDRLTKVRPLLYHAKRTCSELFQPGRNISVDERMVKSKGRSGIRQFMPNKPVRFGYKLWCVCDAANGYTMDFDIYTGRRHHPTEHGLGYDVVSSLVSKYAGQGYNCYFDNFFSSLPLMKHLRCLGLGACGTTVTTRRGFPTELKDKAWARHSARGDMRFIRRDDILMQQWLDNKPVCILSTIHRGDTFVHVQRRMKMPDGSHQAITLRRPTAVNDYNLHMGGVDLSDQRLATYCLLQKCHRWWKTLFFHILDLSVFNSYLLFTATQRQHPDMVELQRPLGYTHLSFREELVCQLGQIADDEDTPMSVRRPRAKSYFGMDNVHVPTYHQERRCCKVCYLMQGKELRSHLKCSHERCDVYLCLNAERNCFLIWHSDAFQQLKELMGK